MKLSSIEFKNFRCFKDEVLQFGSYTSLVGPNNCGKSTALRALTLFFGGSTKAGLITNSDFNIGAAEEEELSLRLEFGEITGDAEEALKHYVRGGRVKFELTATRNNQGQITTRCRGIRYGIPSFAPFFAATKAGERRPLYDELKAQYPDKLLDWRSMEQAEAAVRKLEADKKDEHVPIPSDENAYGATGPVPILKKYIDWIYVPAVKDASSEASEQRDSAFSKLILFAVRNRCSFSEKIIGIQNQASAALQDVLKGADEILQEVGAEVDKEFKSLTTTPMNVAIEWGPIDGISIREPVINSIFKDGRVFGPPEAFGHGLQRTYLMALLRLAASVQKSDVDFQLLLGVEEPELYQHPPQARFLSNALTDLSGKNCQVIVTTHSPYFVTGRTFESIRVLRNRNNQTTSTQWTIDQQRDYCAKRKGVAPIGTQAALSGMDRSLQGNIAEIFFASKVVLVEGMEDVSLIESYLRQIGKLSDFLRAGCHLVPTGGKSKMPMLVALCRGFSIEVFCIFDFDMDLSPAKQANEAIIRYAADSGDIISKPPMDEFKGKYFFGWYATIQKALEDEIDNWKTTKKSISEEWGWELEKMEKDPMLLAETVSRVIATNGDIPPLKRVVEDLEAFWGA